MIRRKSRILRRRKKKRTIIKSRPFQIFLVTLVFIALSFYCLVLADFVQIKKIEINAECVSPALIKDAVETNLGQTVFGFWNSRSIFFTKEREIESVVRELDATIKNVECRKVYFSGLQIDVQIRQPVALYCVRAKETCLLMDEEGFLFQGKELSEIPTITIIDLTQETIAPKDQVLGVSLIRIIETINKTLVNDMGLAVKEYVLLSPERLDLISQEGWRIYFNLTKDIEVELAKLKFLFDKEITEASLKDIDYIDLRYERVFYK